MLDSNEITEKKAIDVITKRIGFLTVRLSEHPDYSFDVMEKKALVKILNGYLELKEENRKLKLALDDGAYNV